MKAETANELRRRGAAACLFAAPALMLAGDALRVLGPGPAGRPQTAGAPAPLEGRAAAG